MLWYDDILLLFSCFGFVLVHPQNRHLPCQNNCFSLRGDDDLASRLALWPSHHKSIYLLVGFSIIMLLYPIILLIISLELSHAWFGNTPGFVRIEPQAPTTLQMKQSFLQSLAEPFFVNRNPSLPPSFQKKQAFLQTLSEPQVRLTRS